MIIIKFAAVNQSAIKSQINDKLLTNGYTILILDTSTNID